MILKRVVYGVDKNPMAVELAKVALWLHTFTVGAPLSFLDHHLRCGDSLFGEWVAHVLSARPARCWCIPTFSRQSGRRLACRASRKRPTRISRRSRASGDAFAGVAEATSPLAHYLDFVHALRWMTLDDQQRRLVEALLDGKFGDVVTLVSSARAAHARKPPPAPSGFKGANAEWNSLWPVIEQAKALAARERFLHWEVAFPGVWSDWESLEPRGGFDAVIGNPPWDRIKLQEVEWFAPRRTEIAMAQRAADRKRLIVALERDGDPLWQNYSIARERAERMAEVVRESSHYPLLARGDVNIYSLFVERSLRLVQPNGISGLLVPSGIGSDYSASTFFRSVSTAGRVRALLDFENRWPTYFPDVDDRFKFSVLVLGGKARRFDQCRCAFFLHDPREIDARSFALTPADFARVNPNTGTAPVFRTRARRRDRKRHLRASACARPPFPGGRPVSVAGQVCHDVSHDKRFGTSSREPPSSRLKGSTRSRAIGGRRPEKSSCRSTRARWSRPMIIAPPASS